jgi:hypothetical protein
LVTPLERDRRGTSKKRGQEEPQSLQRDAAFSVILVLLDYHDALDYVD